mmetsp:Transcript_74496/g.177394  ORF Transcript_74496/g.177394 Transcript_74496/m.177394 type:complete len:149 (+) Transcript_74496:59-505(+)|eukprot:CAMPEP_0178420420 /NCGR_PEP_ID=MMETSP0689_2-20121128/26120_1 /TAXON_ID=160604 /ORGANISM="Amphidinium massartii, Strain CS-259" /LENGTH=148 /DNA_ID=CAMNT_0020041895 /DNA_START=52 /DNA_END=501 /DNA_ORIENTATION=+
MGKKTEKGRRRVPRRPDNKADWKRKADQARRRSRTVRKKQKKAARQVDGLADRLAEVVSTEKTQQESVKAAQGAGDAAMGQAPAPAPAKVIEEQPKPSREELRKRLRAKLAGEQLERTQGLSRGVTDAAGIKKRDGKTKKLGQTMDTS